jgi:hypothetical protein
VILPGGRFQVFVASRPVDFRNYAGRMIMQSRRGAGRLSSFDQRLRRPEPSF